MPDKNIKNIATNSIGKELKCPIEASWVEKPPIADVEKLKNAEGALVASVSEKSPADKAGIKAGDIILE